MLGDRPAVSGVTASSSDLGNANIDGVCGAVLFGGLLASLNSARWHLSCGATVRAFARAGNGAAIEA